jgi:hypothetical protein
MPAVRRLFRIAFNALTVLSLVVLSVAPVLAFAAKSKTTLFFGDGHGFAVDLAYERVSLLPDGMYGSRRFDVPMTEMILVASILPCAAIL